MAEDPVDHPTPVRIHVGSCATGGGPASFQVLARSAKALSKHCFKSGLETHNVTLAVFNQRKAEAQTNVEKLVRAMINAQLTKDSSVDILDEWTISHVLHQEKLCPGLWPVC